MNEDSLPTPELQKKYSEAGFSNLQVSNQVRLFLLIKTSPFGGHRPSLAVPGFLGSLFKKSSALVLRLPCQEESALING